MAEVEIVKRLDRLERGLAELQKRVVDANALLTSDDLDALAAAERDVAAGRTTTSLLQPERGLDRL